MWPFPKPTRRAAWIGLAAVVVLSAGIAVGVWQTRMPERPTVAPPPARGAPEADPADTADDGAIERALRQIPSPVDSTALRSQWRDVVEGVDVSALDSRRREIFVRFANAERCTCGCGYTLAACRTYDTTCPVSLPRLEALLDSVRTGRIRSAAGLRKRPSGQATSPRAPVPGRSRSGG